MKEDIIVDLDGTLCNHEHRQHLVIGPKKFYDQYHDLCLSDTPHEAVLRVVKLLAADGYRIRLLSGRKEPWRIQTIKWLLLYDVPYHDLHMRAVDDNRPDNIMKEDMYRQHCERPVLFVLDDRQRVVDMWRSIGLVCFQVAPGDF